MAFFTLVNMTCTGFGPMVSGWVELDPNLEWRWIQWIHAMSVLPYSPRRRSSKSDMIFNSFSGVYFVIAALTMKETRQSIILRRVAQKMRKETGNMRYRARVEETQRSLRELIWISCTRPISEWSHSYMIYSLLIVVIEFLFTEPVATSISVGKGKLEWSLY